MVHLKEESIEEFKECECAIMLLQGNHDYKFMDILYSAKLDSKMSDSFFNSMINKTNQFQSISGSFD